MTKIVGSGSISQRHGHGSADPDPHQNVMDPEHCYISLDIIKRDRWLIWQRACLSCGKISGFESSGRDLADRG